MSRTRVVIQSRLNSSRLPGKALMTIAGMPLVELVARRASRSGHEVVVATSDEHYDTRIADHLTRVGLRVVRGPLDDVLGRFVQATADLDDGDTVVRLTGDNPVGDATLIDELAAAMVEGGFGYGRNDVSRMPEGLGCEVFSVDDLRRAATEATDTYDREHVTPWLRRNVPTLDFVPRDNPGDPLRYRCTVDVLSDYDRVCRLFGDLPDPVATPWQELVGRLDSPEFTDGESVPTRDTSAASQSLLVLGGSQLAGPDAPSAPEVRRLLATAVGRGVNHVEVGRVDGRAEEILHECGEPQLTQRLRVISRLAPVVGTDAQSVRLSVEASLERSFAGLSRRSASTALLSSLADAQLADGAAWQRLREYRDEGVVGQLGVSLSDPAEVPGALGLPDLTHLEVPLSIVDDRFGGLGAALAGREVVVTAFHAYAGGALLAPGHPEAAALADLAQQLGRASVADLALAYVTGHAFVSSVALGVRNDDQMRQNLELSTHAPLTEAEITTVRERLRLQT